MLSDFQTLTLALVRDDATRLSANDRDIAIANAVTRYGDDRPRPRVEDVTAAAQQLISLPTGWQADYSTISSIETPVGRVPPALLSPERYSLYLDATQTTKVMLLDAVSVGAALRFTFTVRHQLDGSTDTIPAEHREPVCCWAAALLCDQLASLYSNSGDSTIQADSVDHSSRPREFAARAKHLRQRYFDGLGLDPKANVAGGTTVNWNGYDSQGRDRLTHPSRFR